MRGWRICAIHTLDMRGFTGITDAGLAHLRGIHTLYMNRCTGITVAWLVHLRGICYLYRAQCPIIAAAAAFAQLAGASGNR